MNKKINGVVVEVKVGDIAKSGANLIVLPQFPERLCYGNAWQSLWAAEYGGAVDDYLLSAKKKAFSHGDVKFTHKGVNIAHVVTEGVESGEAFDCVFRAMQKVFCEAHDAGYRVIAVPELGTTEEGGLNGTQSAAAVFAALLDHTSRCEALCESCRIEKVIFFAEGDKSGAEEILSTKKYRKFLSDECLGLIKQRELIALIKDICDM